jgi:hypothetical protein
MISEQLNKIEKFSKNNFFDYSRNYKFQGRTSMPYEAFIGYVSSIPKTLFLIHKNMVFDRNTITDSFYEVWSFDENGNSKKIEVEQLEPNFFKDIQVIKTI